MTADAASLLCAIVKRYGSTAGPRRAALVRAVHAWRDLDDERGEVVAVLTGPWPALAAVLDNTRPPADALAFDALDLATDLEGVLRAMSAGGDR